MADKPDIDMGKTFTALVRIHEANCGIDYPTDEEHNFRLAIMKKLGLQLGLSEVRDLGVSGPGGKGAQRPARSS